MPEQLPPVPDGFEVLDEFGRGRAAVVWRARYLLTDEVVALKVWWRPLDDEYERRRFSAECQWHRRLSGHPNVVGWVWASSPTAGHPWIATQVHGTSLAERLRRDGPPDLPTALGIGLDLLDGLAAMHARGLLHRDVKPSNVLVDDDGRAALCDLGIVLPVDEVTRECGAGTPGYVAPELEHEGQHPDRRSDVYSAAAVIATLVGDRAPEPVDHLVHAVAGSDRPEDRPADAADFARRVRSAMRGAGVAAPAVGAGAAPTRPRRRRSVLTAAALSAVLAGGAATGVAVERWRSGDDGGAAARGAVDAPTTAAAPTTQAAPDPVAARAVLAVVADVGPDGRPVLRPPKPSGFCVADQPPAESVDVPSGGQVVASVRLYLTEGGWACAKFVKSTTSGLHDTPSYLALSLCNSRGDCDHDWNRYAVDAGPVRVRVPDGCLTWRVSAMDAAETQWLVRDESGTRGCRS